MARTPKSSTAVIDETPEVVEANQATTEEAAEQANQAEETEARAAIEAFNEAVAKAVAEADQGTGQVANQYTEAVAKAYRNIPGIKPKNQVKVYLTEKVAEALENDDLTAAKVYMHLKDKATVAAKTRTPAARERAEVDPAQAFADRITTLRVAGAFAATEAPEGANGWADKVGDIDSLTDEAAKYAAWLDSDAENKGDEPDVSVIVKQAVRVARGKATRGGGSTGPRVTNGLRRDVAAHIENAFKDKSSGAFMTVAEILAVPSDEYGTDRPSPGAVSARLFPSSGKPCTVNGITPGQNEKGVRGATKN